MIMVMIIIAIIKIIITKKPDEVIEYGNQKVQCHIHKGPPIIPTLRKLGRNDINMRMSVLARIMIGIWIMEPEV